MKNFLLTFSLLINTIILSHGQNIKYVTQSGAGVKDGSSWNNAYDATQLRQALLVASGNTEFWVAAGIYKPTQNNDRTISFVLGPNIKILGGFLGNETSSSARDFVNNKTIFSGDLNNNDSNTDFTPSEITRSDNSYHLFSCINADTTTVLDGLTVKSGNANSTDPYINAADGVGGVFAFHFSNSTNINAGIKFVNCNLTKNSANHGGVGAVYLQGNRKVDIVFENCEIDSNHALRAGVLDLSINTVKVNIYTRNSKFSNNSVSDYAGVFNMDNTGEVLLNLKKTVFLNNKSANYGSVFQMDNQGSGVFKVIADEISISENQSKGKGAMSIRSIWSGGYDLKFSNSLFNKNSVTGKNVFEGQGAVLFLESETNNDKVLFKNCTFEENTANHIGSVMAGEIGYNNPNLNFAATFSKCLIRNNIIKAGLINLDVAQNNSAVFEIDSTTIENNVPHPNGAGWDIGLGFTSHENSNFEVKINNSVYSNNWGAVVLDTQNDSKMNFYATKTKFKGTTGYHISSYSYITSKLNTFINNCYLQNSTSNAINVFATYGSSPTVNYSLRNCVISSNLGGGINCRTDDGGISNIEIYNSTITQNSAYSGGGIYLFKNNSSSQNVVSLKNTILSGNQSYTGDNEYNILSFSPYSATLNADYSNITQNNFIYPGTGNLNTIPYFNDLANDNFRLNEASCCLNLGNNAFILSGEKDLDGLNRINGQRTDMGAFEYDNCPIIKNVNHDYFGWGNRDIEVKASDAIISNKVIHPSKVIFDSKNKIILNPGFEIKSGSVFETKLIGCSN